MIRRNELSQEITFTPDERAEVVSALKEIVRDTEIGRQYKSDFYTEEGGDTHLEMILSAAQLVSGGELISISAMTRALELLISSGEIRPLNFEVEPELTEPEPDTRPRTRDGKLMTDAQIAWSEYRQFAETHSSADCRKRAQTDAGFRNFMVKNLERELNQPVADGVVPVGEQNLLPRHTPDQELVEFARKFQIEPRQNLKPRNGTVVLAGEVIPYNKFVQLVDKASASRLI